MSRFRNTTNGMVVSVDDSKDGRFAGLEWEAATEESTPKKAPAKKASSE